MNLPRSTWGMVVVVIYLIAFIVGIRDVFVHPGAKFSGLILIALTFPWSSIEIVLRDSLGIIDSLSNTTQILILIPGAIPNVIFLYWIWAAIERSLKRKSA